MSTRAYSRDIFTLRRRQGSHENALFLVDFAVPAAEDMIAESCSCVYAESPCPKAKCISL